MIRVGLVGCGTIGLQLARALQQPLAHAARLTAMHDVDPYSAASLRRRLRIRPPVVSLPELIRRSDLVLEAASAEAVPEVVARSLRAHRSVLVMSVGGLLRDASWRRQLRHSRGTLYIPSGALAGLDGIQAMALGRLDSAPSGESISPEYECRRRLIAGQRPAGSSYPHPRGGRSLHCAQYP